MWPNVGGFASGDRAGRHDEPATLYRGSVRTISLDEVTAAIDETSRREPGGAVAFDGDGTLWAGDVGEDFFHALVDGAMREAARAALAEEARREGVDVEGAGTASDIAHRIHRAYLAGAFPEQRICEIMTWAAAGWARAELDAFCREVVRRGDVESRLHGEAVHVVEHARRAGIEVFIVSASPAPIVEQAARLVGIDPAFVIAAREARDEHDVVRCDVDRPIPYGDGKVHRLRERVRSGRTLYAAFGDNAFDVPLLREARIPVAVRPKKRLVDRAGEVPDLRTLEQVERRRGGGDPFR